MVWPADFQAALAELIAPRLPKNLDCKPDAVISRLLRENRVVLFLDALDQATDAGKNALKNFLRILGVSEGRGEPISCRIIVTCRPYADATMRNQVESFWRMARIERWDVRRQYAYLFRPDRMTAPIGGSWLKRQLKFTDMSPLIPAANVDEGTSPRDAENAMRLAIRSLIPARDDDDPIVSNPQALFLIRQFYLERDFKNINEPTRFASLGDLYRVVCRRSLERAYQKSVNNEKHVSDDILEWLEAMLGAMAFQMLTVDPVRFSFGDAEDDDLPALKSDAFGRATIKQPIFADLFRDEPPWEVVTAVSQLTSRLTGVYFVNNRLAWPDQRMKEYYAARHLVKNSQPNWVVRPQEGPIGCGDTSVRQNAADPQWSNVWRLALDLAATSYRHLEQSIASLSTLFLRSNERLLRPTEPMYRAWELFQTPKFKLEGNRIIGAFQSTFLDLLRGDDHRQAAIAAQCMPLHKLRKHVTDVPLQEIEKILAAQKQLPLSRTFVRCPPSEQELRCSWTGDGVGILGDEWNPEEKYGPLGLVEFGDEERHAVKLDPYWMAATQTTREQYALFDPYFQEWSNRRNQLPSDANWRCPVTNLDWYSAFSYALFTGNSLPTEAQWEIACRAGSADHYCFAKVHDTDQLITPESLHHVAYYGKSIHAGPQHVAKLSPNSWGLYDILGNVWEWVLDWYGRTYYRSTEAYGPNPTGPPFGASRVVRGGSFCDAPVRLRCAARTGLAPGRRNAATGFRIVCDQKNL